MKMRAKVKLLMVPTVQLCLGSNVLDEDGNETDTFAAEEQYLITKSGFTGYLNVVHEDGPGDSTDLLTKHWDWLESCLRSAFKEGAPNMTARERVQLLEAFKVMASSNEDHRFELVDNHCGGATCPGHGEEDGSLPWCPDAKFHSGYEDAESSQDEDRCGCSAHDQPCMDCFHADKDPVTQVEDCPVCGPACICDTIQRCKRTIMGDDEHEG